MFYDGSPAGETRRSSLNQQRNRIGLKPVKTSNPIPASPRREKSSSRENQNRRGVATWPSSVDVATRGRQIRGDESPTQHSIPSVHQLVAWTQNHSLSPSDGRDQVSTQSNGRNLILF